LGKWAGKIESTMKKNINTSLPTLPAAVKARLQTLSTEVRGLWALEDSVATRISLKIGHKLLEAEKAVLSIFGKKRDVWGQFQQFYFPEIDPRKAERCMHLARNIDLEAPTILFCLSQASLDRLIGLAGKQDIQDFLAANKIEVDPEMDLKNRQEVATFKKEVLDLIAELTPDKGSGNSDLDHGEENGKQPEHARRPKITEPLDNLKESLVHVEQLLTSITASKDFKGRKRTQFRVRLIKFRKVLTRFLESTSDKD